MSFELLSEILLILSGAGLLCFIFRKIPALIELPELSVGGFAWKKFLARFNGKIKTLAVFKSFSYESALQKILAKFRILTMKTENKTFTWLQQLKERTKESKSKRKDSYWEEIKKVKNKNLPG